MNGRLVINLPAARFLCLLFRANVLDYCPVAVHSVLRNRAALKKPR